jgi:fluoride ion exporter CrcB/FEX
MHLLLTYLVIAVGTALGGLARMAPATMPWRYGGRISRGVGSSSTSWDPSSSAALPCGPDGRIYVDPLGRQLVMVGPGGYTTLSAFSPETLTLLQTVRPLAAGAYLALAVVLCLAAAWSGRGPAQQVNR